MAKKFLRLDGGTVEQRVAEMEEFFKLAEPKAPSKGKKAGAGKAQEKRSRASKNKRS